MKQPRWTTRAVTETSADHERDARMGPPEQRAQNAVVVRTSRFVGTLGPDHGWKRSVTPYVQLTLSLPSDRLDLQAKLTEELKAFADRFIAENGLEPR